MIYWEDVEVGAVQRFGAYAVTREEVLAFARAYDPQPFHLDDKAAAQSLFGRLSASGWHTCAMTMRMLVDHMTEQRMASLGSPGVDALRWLRPVHPGDTLSVETEVLSKRLLDSRPGVGIHKSRTSVFNQDEVEVMQFTANMLSHCRPA